MRSSSAARSAGLFRYVHACSHGNALGFANVLGLIDSLPPFTLAGRAKKQWIQHSHPHHVSRAVLPRDDEHIWRARCGHRPPLAMEEQVEEEAAAASLFPPTQEAPTASQLRQPLLPWALAQTPAGRGQRKRGWGWRQLAQLVLWQLPTVRWLPRYTRRQGLGDALGAVCIAVMVIPQGMSCAVLAGLLPVYGLFAAMSGPFVYTLLGSSRHLSIGPVALVSLGLPRVCEAVYPVADLPDDDAAALRVQAATAVALVSGVVLAVLGLLRLGTLAHFIPPAVMVSFTSAAALSIGMSQIKELLGIPNVPCYPYTWHTSVYVLTHLGDGQPASAVRRVDCFCLSVCFFLPAYDRRCSSIKCRLTHNAFMPHTPNTTQSNHRSWFWAASSSSWGPSALRPHLVTGSMSCAFCPRLAAYSWWS